MSGSSCRRRGFGTQFGACVLLVGAGLGGWQVSRGAPLVDTERRRVVWEPLAGARPARAGAPLETLATEIVVVGGSLGGVAAALAACETGRRVVLLEEDSWAGGQLTAQGVGALDEHLHIERFGGTRLYNQLRGALRAAYTHRYRLSDWGRQSRPFNAGRAWAATLTVEPRVAWGALQSLLAPHVAAGRLTLLVRWKAYAARRDAGRVRSVDCRHLESDRRLRVAGRFFLDATDLGDLLPLAGAAYVTGAESRAETGEPGAPADGARPDGSQPFGYGFAMERSPAPGAAAPRPVDYAHFRTNQPYSFLCEDGTQRPPTSRMFEKGDNGEAPFWSYRRLVAAANFDDLRVATDVALILWPGNDFHTEGLIDRPAADVVAALRRAREVSRGLAHWLQTEAPRDEGGRGYPELRLRPDAMGSSDGLSRMPYVRESRRIVPLRRVVEQEIAARCQPGARAAFFGDSVGIGCRGIDIHTSTPNELNASQPTRPFQIPLAALVPRDLENLLPASKNLGTTHITNGAYRMHPVEWNIGESAGRLAAFCLERATPPRRVASEAGLLRDFQGRLLAYGVPLAWYVDVPQRHPAFFAVQMLAVRGLWPRSLGHLLFWPRSLIGAREATALLTRARVPSIRRGQILARAGIGTRRPAYRAQLAIAWWKVLEAGEKQRGRRSGAPGAERDPRFTAAQAARRG